VGDPCVIRHTTVSGCASGIMLSGWRARCAVESCTIKDNQRQGVTLSSMEDALVMRTTFQGCGLGVSYTPDVEVIACSFRNCASGAIVTSFSALTLASSLITDTEDAFQMCEYSSIAIRNSTISHCNSPVAGEGDVRVNSSIVWGNSRQLSDPAIKWMISEVITSGIEGGFEPPDPHAANIDLDPLFRDPDNGDFHLRPESPCIDYFEWDGPLYDFDLDGNPRRLYGGRVPHLERDLGAYEYRINQLAPGPSPDETSLTWSSLYDRTYSIFYTDDLLSWHLAVENFPSAGSMTTSWTDDGSLTGVPPSLVPRRFYRILENP